MEDRGEELQATAIILAGGQSARIGRDKAFIEVGGVPLIERVLERVRQVVAEVVIVTNSVPEHYAHLHARVVPDVVPGKGPLVGIYSGLRAARNELAMVVACDMPFINPELLRYMLARSSGYDVVIPRAAVKAAPRGLHCQPRPIATAKTEGLHPLHAVYRRTCIPAIEGLIGTGDLRVIAFLSAVRVRYVETGEFTRFDPQQRSFFNVNTLAEWEQAQEFALQATCELPHS